MNKESNLEYFYVYRSLHSDESWGALLGCSAAGNLPNIDFGMIVYATNEKRAIARARDLYEKVHKYDSDKDNLRRFTCSALKAAVEAGKSPEEAATSSMKYAKRMNEVFRKHFEETKDNDTEYQSALEDILEERY